MHFDIQKLAFIANECAHSQLNDCFYITLELSVVLHTKKYFSDVCITNINIIYEGRLAR